MSETQELKIETQGSGITNAAPDDKDQTIVISEDPIERKHRIRALQQQIEETTTQQQSIKRLQETYNDIPDEALTETDLSIKQTDVALLQKELELLLQKQKETGGGIKQTLKKIGSFFSLY